MKKATLESLFFWLLIADGDTETVIQSASFLREESPLPGAVVHLGDPSRARDDENCRMTRTIG